MNIKQLLTRKNAQLATAVLLAIATVCLLPQVRSAAIFLAERLMNRSLDHAYWQRFLFLQTLKACTVIGAGVVLLSAWKTDDTRNNNILVFTVAILTMFVISNIDTVLVGVPFVGFWTYWNFGDFIPILNTGEYNPLVSGYRQTTTFYDTNYPPLAVVFFKIIFAFVPTDQPLEPYTSNYLLSLYTLMTSVALTLFISKWLKQNNILTMCFVFSIFFTAPFLLNYERLNTLLLALVFTFIYLLCYNSPDKRLKECALISLAIAANIKLYPAIFGLLLVKKKDWKTAIRCALYGIVLFFLPALLGGLATNSAETVAPVALQVQTEPVRIEQNLSSLADKLSFFGDYYRGQDISISSQVYNLLDAFGLLYLQNICIPIAIGITLILGIGLFFFAKTRHQELLFLSSMCMFVPGVSHWHTTAFLLFPLLDFLNSENKKSLFNKVELFLYILIFLFVWRNSLYTIIKPEHTHHVFTLLFLNAVLICKDTDFKAAFRQLKFKKTPLHP